MKHAKLSFAKFAASLPKCIAYCGLIRTLRPMHRFNRLETGLIILRLPANITSEYYRAAAEFLLGTHDWRQGRNKPMDTFVTVIGSKKQDWPEQVGDWLDNASRVIAYCECTQEIPFDVRLAADAILDLDVPTVRDVIGGWRMSGRGRIAEREAEQIRDVPFPVLDAVAREGRSAPEVIDRVIQAASYLPAEPGSQDPSVKEKSGPLLEDLVGMGDAEGWGRELAHDLRDWKAGIIPWSAVDRGILLSGPPGCGKTTFAKALANTCGVELVSGSLAQWQASGYLNALLKSMRAAFEDAKKKAPAILFIDEVDAFGDRAKFDGHNEQYCTEVVSGFLECLDGVEGREGVVVVGAANHPERLDAAITRAGRLDRHVRVSLPDEAARREILDRLFARQLDAVKLQGVAERLPGRSGADLEKLARDASRRARREGRQPSVDDLEACLPERQELPHEYRWRIAVHEAGHAIIGLEAGYGVIKHASVARWHDAALDRSDHGRVQFTVDQTCSRTLARVEAEIATFLAGAAAETLVFGDYSAGVGGAAGSDLHVATATATAAYRSWGLGGRLAYMEQSSESTAGLAFDRDASQWVNDLLDRILQTTLETLRHRERKLVHLASELIAHDELDGAGIKTILDSKHTARRRPRRAA